MSKSAVELRLAFEPDPDPGYRNDPDLSASWGSFELWVGPTNLCRHVADSQVHDRVCWYLLPMLEWFVENWDRFFHESRTPAGLIQERSARESWLASEPYELEDGQAAWVESWWMSHAIRAAAQGGIFPDVFLRRYRDDLEISWGPAAVAGTPADLRFLAPSGRTVVPADDAATELYESAGQAIDQLLKLHTSARIERLSAAHAALSQPSAHRASPTRKTSGGGEFRKSKRG